MGCLFGCSRFCSVTWVSSLPLALLTLVAVFPLGGVPLVAQDTPVEKDLFGLMDAASGRNSQFRMRAVFQLPMDGQTQDIMVDLNRDGQDYDLSLVHSDYSMIIRRRGPGTALAIPRHRVVYIGMGEAPAEDGLGYEGLAVRVISAFSEFGSMAPLMIQGQPAMVMSLASRPWVPRLMVRLGRSSLAE